MKTCNILTFALAISAFGVVMTGCNFEERKEKREERREERKEHREEMKEHREEAKEAEKAAKEKVNGALKTDATTAPKPAGN